MCVCVCVCVFSSVSQQSKKQMCVKSLNLTIFVGQDLGKYGLLYYNSLLMLIPAFAMIVFSDELDKVSSVLFTLEILLYS